MRYIIVAPVRDGGAQVRKVEGSASYFSLAYGQRDHIGGFPPAFPVHLVIVFRVRDETAELRREVASEFSAETETPHILMPDIQGFRDGPVFRIFENSSENIAVVCVARHHDGLFEIQRRTVVMTSQPVPSELVSHVARIFRPRSEHPFLKSYKSVYKFEYRPGRVGRLDGPVEHWLVRVCKYFVVVRAYVGEHLHIYSGT